MLRFHLHCRLFLDLHLPGLLLNVFSEFVPCWKLCIYVFSRSLWQRSYSSHVPMDFLQLREHIICCSSILPPPTPLIDCMISITTIHFSLHQAVISSVHASARETSLLFSLCNFSGRKFPGGLRRCRPTRLCPDCFYQRLTGCSWGTKHCSSNVRFCWIPLSERSHMKAQISNQPISCISQLLLSDSCGGDPQVHNFSHPNGAQMQMYI